MSRGGRGERGTWVVDVSEPSNGELVERIEQIIEWSRNLTARERETLREAVVELRRSERRELVAVTAG